MTKPYSWDEIQDFLKKALKKTNHIMTFSTIGSTNIENDIDVVITRKPKSKTSDLYMEIHNLFDDLNAYLKKYNGKVIRFPIEKNLALYAAGYTEKDLAFHSLIYTNYSQINRDWSWFLFDDQDVKDIISKSSFLLGSLKDLSSKEFQISNYYDPAYIILYWSDLCNSSLPDELLLKSMNDNFDSILKKRLKLEKRKAENIEEIRKVFYDICDTLDELSEKKK